MKTGGRVSQSLTRLLREFRSQGYALLQRNSSNLVYVCAAMPEIAPPSFLLISKLRIALTLMPFFVVKGKEGK
jgi:hypothetical protein